MSHKSSVIKCQKCGRVSNIIDDTCLECGATLEKICGNCGFANAVQKNYCDQCGTLLTLKPGPPSDAEKERSAKKSKQLEIQPIQDAMAERDASFRGKSQGKAAHEPEPPDPAPAEAAPVREIISPPPSEQPRADSGRSAPSPLNSRRNLYGTVLFAGMAVTLAFFLYLIIVPAIPKVSLKMAAKSYLKKLSSGRYVEAYEMLSTNSKAVCPLSDYVDYSAQYYGKLPSWQFKDIEVFAMEANAAMVKYQLKEGTGAWRSDYVSFVREQNKWTRPYIWTLFEPIEAAMEKQDHAQALFLSQKLYLTDPMDPRASGYLCVSEFFMGLYDKAAESCKRTVNSARIYPVGFGPEEIFWYKFYYADSLRLVGKLEAALAEYDDLVRSETGSMREQCSLFLSRGDAYVKLKRYDSALNDMLRADGVCSGDMNHEEAARRLRFINGEARADAISFAQKSRAGQDLPTFRRLRSRSREELSARLGPKNMKYMPRDTWVAAHLAGPEYRVVLREEVLNAKTRRKEVREVYVLKVDLWNSSIKIEYGELPRPDGKE